MLSGKPGSGAASVSSPPGRSIDSNRYDDVSATNNRVSSALSATPFGNDIPFRSTSILPSGVRRSSRPVSECSSRSAFHRSTLNRADESVK